ncbi:MAG TPA: alpha-E domain-containing protein [Niabella sp.]|nr:alpha-E domain-containing protein [Niabella sp.]HOZ98330.1 alpha-E domain-containing protein [Niabella sp.]HQW13409.1 alpha-E domain-containing protein [Niabella sp.]HQX18803.1 alpha-E domain-containing protein [Niabella sp.]HQX42034.1 alpha-E domain-containing protein [Niabella sp.]
MLSRVAESVFWMARYMERTNGLLRVLRTNYVASQDEMKKYNWTTVLETFGCLSDSDIGKIQNDSRLVLKRVMLDKDNESSLINNITRARENAKSIQDNITKEMWHHLNSYYHLIRDPYISEMILNEDPITAMDALIKHSLFLYGTIEITMPRGEANNFLNLGRFLERAIITMEATEIMLKEINYEINLESSIPPLRYLLYSLSGYEAYLRNSKGVAEASSIMNQIIFDENFAHSVMYCITHINRYFRRMKTASTSESFEKVEFNIGKALNNLKYVNIDLSQGSNIHQLLITTRTDFYQIAQSLSTNYFGY